MKISLPEHIRNVEDLPAAIRASTGLVVTGPVVAGEVVFVGQDQTRADVDPAVPDDASILVDVVITWGCLGPRWSTRGTYSRGHLEPGELVFLIEEGGLTKALPCSAINFGAELVRA
jgi:hypothetical protein